MAAAIQRNVKIMMGSAGKTPFASIRTPRLSVLHLMLWTLCSAVYLTLIRAVYLLQEMPDDYAAIQQSSSVFYGMIGGAVLTGAVVLGHARLRYGHP